MSLDPQLPLARWYCLPQRLLHRQYVGIGIRIRNLPCNFQQTFTNQKQALAAVASRSEHLGGWRWVLSKSEAFNGEAGSIPLAPFITGSLSAFRAFLPAPLPSLPTSPTLFLFSSPDCGFAVFFRLQRTAMPRLQKTALR
jgi:hypothetical protein